MNELAIIELIGTIAVPLIVAALGLMIAGHRNTVKELREAISVQAQHLEDHRRDISAWQLKATVEFAQKAEVARDFGEIKQSMDRLETKLDQVITRLIPKS